MMKNNSNNRPVTRSCTSRTRAIKEHPQPQLEDNVEDEKFVVENLQESSEQSTSSAETGEDDAVENYAIAQVDGGGACSSSVGVGKSRGRPRLTPRNRVKNSSQRSSKRNLKEKQRGTKRKSDVLSEELYEIDTILDKDIDDNGVAWYLVHWKTFPKRQSTWEPIEHLSGAEDILDDFENRLQNVSNLENRLEEPESKVEIVEVTSQSPTDLGTATLSNHRIGRNMWPSFDELNSVMTSGIYMFGVWTAFTLFNSLDLIHCSYE